MQLRWNTPREGGGGGGATPTATATVMQRLRAQTVLCMRHVQRVLACSGDDGGVVEPGGYLHAALHVTVYLNYPLILLQMRQEGSSVLQEELVEHLKKLVQECVRYDLEIPGAGGSSRGRSGSNYSVFEAGSGYYRSYSVLSNSDDEDVPQSFIAWHLHRHASCQLSLPTHAHLAFWLWFRWHTLATSERSGYPLGRVVRKCQVGSKYSISVKR